MSFIQNISFMNFTKLIIVLAPLSSLTQTMGANERKCYVLHPPNQNILYAFSAVENKHPQTGKVTYQNPRFLKEQKNIAISPNLHNLCVEGNVFPAIVSSKHLLNQKDTISFFYDQDGVYYPMERKQSSDLLSDYPCYKCKRHIHSNHELFTFAKNSYSRNRYNLCLNCASDEMEPKNVKQAMIDCLIKWRDADNQVNNKLDEGIINYIYEYAKPNPILPKHPGSRFKIVKLSGEKYSLTFKITVALITAGAIGLFITIRKIHLVKKKSKKALVSQNEKQKELEKAFLETPKMETT